MFDALNHKLVVRRTMVGVFLFVTGIFTTFIVWNNTLRSPQTLQWEKWAYSEWLISYANGFVRRGAIGELLLQYFSNSLLSAVNHMVFISYVTLIATFCFLILLRAEDNVARAAVAILIPGGIAQMALTNEFYYRKEIIFHVYLTVLGIVAIVEEGRSQRIRLVTSYLFALLSLFMLLIHESFAFLTLPATIVILKRSLADIKTKRFFIGLAALQATMFAILIVFKGSMETAQVVWARIPLSDRFILSPEAPETATGGIEAIGWSLLEALRQPLIIIMLSGLAWLWVLAAAGLIFILWLFFGQSHISERTSPFDFVDCNFAFSIIVIFGSSLPLYLLGHDWGRWLSASVISTIIVYYTSFYPSLHQYSSGLKLARVQHSLWGTLILLSLVIASSFLTRLPECCITAYPQSAYVTLRSIFTLHGILRWLNL